MEGRKISAYGFVPSSSSLTGGAAAGNLRFSLQIAGDPSSHIVVGNFPDSRSYLKAPKAETATFDLNDVAGNPYELPPLPELLSLDSPPAAVPHSPLMIGAGSDDLMPVLESLSKRLRPSPFYPPPPPPPNLNAISILRPQRMPSKEIARRRRSRISDRIKILGGLMPWEVKMNMARLLEEAHKYIRFLEAQVTALQSMPAQSTRFWPVIGVGDPSGGEFMGLELLNRQQMLQVVVNSSMAQSFLYKKGCCVFSAEQVAELRRRMVAGMSPSGMLLLGSCSSST